LPKTNTIFSRLRCANPERGWHFYFQNPYQKGIFFMSNDNKKEIIDALHVVIAEFDENPIDDTKANDVMIEVMSERVEKLISE